MATVNEEPAAEEFDHGDSQVDLANHQSDLPHEPPGDPDKQPSEQVDNSHVVVSLDSLQARLKLLVETSESQQSMAVELLQLAQRLTNSIWTGWFAKSQDGVYCTGEMSSIREQRFAIPQSSLLPSASAAIASGKAQVNSNGSLTVICAPVFGLRGVEENPNACLCLALNLGDERPQAFLLIAQLLANAMAQRNSNSQFKNLDWEVEATAAISDLLSKVVNSNGLSQASMTAANELAGFLNSPLVAVGTCRNAISNKVRVRAISGVGELDRGGKLTRLIASALEETRLREGLTTYPELNGDDRSMKLAHRKLQEQFPNCCVVSSPLKTSDGKFKGAWLCVLPRDNQFIIEDDRQVPAIRFHLAASVHLGDALEASQRAAASGWHRIAKSILSAFGGKVGRILLAACLLMTLALLIPVPHRIHCDCELKPTVRRFAVAPHDGILLKSLVRPGDVVRKGQVIARMDETEIALRINELSAQRDAALRKRDVNRSGRDAAAIQIAELDVRQLDAQIELLNYQKENLEIKSSVEGVVLSGDLNDAEGASVRAGDVLLEIAPLETLRLELNISDSDISHVDVENEVTFVLAGKPLEAQKTKVTKIRPAAELRNNQNVYVSEVDIPNLDSELRPGMHGHARIESGTRPLGWVLLHRPIERVYQLFR